MGNRVFDEVLSIGGGGGGEGRLAPSRSLATYQGAARLTHLSRTVPQRVRHDEAS